MLLNLDIDLLLITLFLVVNISIGLWYGKDITSMQDYALGGRKFSTAALAATIISTWIGGGSFSLLEYLKYIQ